MRPNIVLITIECWRGDYFGTVTPNLNSLSAQSVTFEDAQVLGGWTLPSMTGLMSSAYGSMHGGLRVALKSPYRAVLAERLLRAGYWTAGITANPVCGVTNGFHRGFGFFEELRPVVPPHLGLAALTARNDWQTVAGLGISPQELDGYPTARQVTKTAIRWLDSHAPKDPFFLWIHYLDPHWPFLTPERPVSRKQVRSCWEERQLFYEKLKPARGRYDMGDTGARWLERYRDAVSITDGEIGVLLEGLKRRADWDRTMVVATGDHGEEFGEHGTWLHQWNQLHREGIQVPLIARIPQVQPARINATVSHLDLAPTLLDFAGLEADSGMCGTSLRGLLNREKEAAAGPIYTEMLGHPDASRYLIAIREGQWKYIHDIEDPLKPKLFDVLQDPLEKENVIGRFPQLYRKFEQLRLAHLARGVVDLMSPAVGAMAPEDDLAREQLAALGYV